MAKTQPKKETKKPEVSAPVSTESKPLEITVNEHGVIENGPLAGKLAYVHQTDDKDDTKEDRLYNFFRSKFAPSFDAFSRETFVAAIQEFEAGEK